MSTLIEQIAIGSPFIWVRTDEPHRVYEMIMERDSRRKLYRMDIFDGFVMWDKPRDRWVQVLVPSEDPDQPDGPTGKLSDAIDHLLRAPGIFFMEHAHMEIKSLISFLTGVNWRFLTAVKKNDADAHPLQFVCMSHDTEIPPEIRRMAVMVEHSLPNEDDLGDLADKLMTAKQGEHSDRANVVRAAKGMTEGEMVSASLLSLREHGSMRSDSINDAKLEKIKTDGLLEVTVPQISLDDIGGLDNAKRLIKNISWIWQEPERARELGVEPLRRILLVGVPGTGKSALCEATAKSLDLQLGKGGVSSAMSKWIGESEANMRRMFAQLKAMAPIVFWIDEFGRDMSGSGSSNSTDGGTTDRTHGEFLSGLQSLDPNILLMGAANRVEDLPPEMLRADRFDKIMFVGFPTVEERVDIFRIHLGEHAGEYDLEVLAEATDLFTGAEIKHLIRETRFSIVCEHHRAPTTDELIAHAPLLKNRVWLQSRDAIKTMYEKALTDWEWASSDQEAEAESILTGKSRRRKKGVVKDVTEQPTSSGGLATFFDPNN